MMSSVSWAYLEESTVVADQPVQLFGVHVNSGTGGSYIDVYNGQELGQLCFLCPLSVAVVCT